MLLTLAQGKQISSLRNVHKHLATVFSAYLSRGAPTRRLLQTDCLQGYRFNWQYAAIKSKLHETLDCTKPAVALALGA